MKISYFGKWISDKCNKDLWLKLQPAQMVFDDIISRGNVIFFMLKNQLYRFGIIWQDVTLHYVCNQCIWKLTARFCWQSARYFKHVLFSEQLKSLFLKKQVKDLCVNTERQQFLISTKLFKLGLKASVKFFMCVWLYVGWGQEKPNNLDFTNAGYSNMICFIHSLSSSPFAVFPSSKSFCRTFFHCAI